MCREQFGNTDNIYCSNISIDLELTKFVEKVVGPICGKQKKKEHEGIDYDRNIVESANRNGHIYPGEFIKLEVYSNALYNFEGLQDTGLFVRSSSSWTFEWHAGNAESELTLSKW